MDLTSIREHAKRGEALSSRHYPFLKGDEATMSAVRRGLGNIRSPKKNR